MGCQCGAIVFECTGTPSVVCLCHGGVRRRSVGATPVAWATYARAEVRLTRGLPRYFASSDVARRGFCETCGTALFFESAHAPDEVDVTVAVMEDPDALAPDRHIWVPSKVEWACTGDRLPSHVADAGSATIRV